MLDTKLLSTKKHIHKTKCYSLFHCSHHSRCRMRIMEIPSLILSLRTIFSHFYVFCLSLSFGRKAERLCVCDSPAEVRRQHMKLYFLSRARSSACQIEAEAGEGMGDGKIHVSRCQSENCEQIPDKLFAHAMRGFARSLLHSLRLFCFFLAPHMNMKIIIIRGNDISAARQQNKCNASENYFMNVTCRRRVSVTTA